MGLPEQVDVVLDSNDLRITLQVKSRKKLGKIVRPNTKVVDCQVIKEDRGDIFFVMEISKFVEILKHAH